MTIPYSHLHCTNLGVVEGQPQAVALQDGAIVLHCSNGHLSSHSESTGSERLRVTGKESHHVERLLGVVERTTYLQVQIVHAVTIT